MKWIMVDFTFIRCTDKGLFELDAGSRISIAHFIAKADGHWNIKGVKKCDAAYFKRSRHKDQLRKSWWNDSGVSRLFEEDREDILKYKNQPNKFMVWNINNKPPWFDRQHYIVTTYKSKKDLDSNMYDRNIILY